MENSVLLLQASKALLVKANEMRKSAKGEPITEREWFLSMPSARAAKIRAIACHLACKEIGQPLTKGQLMALEEFFLGKVYVNDSSLRQALQTAWEKAAKGGLIEKTEKINPKEEADF